MNPVEIKNLHFKYNESENNILCDLNFSVKAGEIVSILGLSGCGKSTLCYCLCGIIPHIYHGVQKGEVYIFGRPVSDYSLGALSTKAGIVFQDPDTQLFSPTVEDEIAFGPENICLERKEIGRRIDKNLKIVNMERYRLEHPENLSGGEKQLIAIASVLAFEPKIILFDESLSQIDSEGVKRIKDVIKKLSSDGRTIIMVEHDIENIDIADRVFFMKDGSLYPVESKEEGDLIGLYKT